MNRWGQVGGQIGEEAQELFVYRFGIAATQFNQLGGELSRQTAGRTEGRFPLPHPSRR